LNGFIKSPMNIDQTLQQAITHHQAGELEDAEKRYRSILTEEPKHADANHHLGVLLKQGDQADRALSFFKTALESNPNHGQFWISYIETLIHLGKLDAARSVLEQGQSKGLKGDAFDQLVARLSLQSETTSTIQVPSKAINPARLLSRAKSHAKKGETQAAQELYSQVLEAYPKNQQAKKGLKAIQQGQVNKKNPSGPPQAQLDSLIVLYSQGQIQKALTASEALIKDYPNKPLLYNISGACYKALGQLEAAVKSYKEALAIKPDYAEVHYNLGNSLKVLGQLEKAVKCYKQALAIKPDYAEAHYNLGVTLYELGQLEVAVKRYEQALAIKPDYAEAHSNLGLTLQALGQLEASVKHFEQALAIKPDYAEAHYNLGITLKELGQLEAAVKRYEEVLAIKPDYVEAHYNLGNTLQELGQLEAAVKRYEQALAIKPDYAEAHSNLGNTLKELDQLDAAVTSYEQALIIKPDYAEAHSNLGITLQELGQLEKAVTSYEQALIIKPDYAEAHSNLGITLQELGQLEKAVKCYEQALAIKPEYAEAHSNLGLTLQELGQLDAAIKSYEQALAIKPDYAEAHSNFGNTLQKLGQLDLAVKSYELALGINPDFVEAWNNVLFAAKSLDLSTTQNAWLESYKKKLDEAISNGVHFKILEYRLNAFTPHMVDAFFDNAIYALPLKTSEEILNPSPTHQNKKPGLISDNMIGLIPFGRSGSLLLHSLIDNHPEISTLPNVYFSEYYNADVWGKLIAQGWDQLPENFIKKFAVLFDARSSVPVPSINKPLANLGKKEGMANVGINKDEVLTVDQNRFCVELQKLMRGYAILTPQTFFTLVHSAYEKTLNKSSNKQTIFYHIHNPSPYAKINFLRYNPEARLLMIVREPIQSCESWVKNVINDSSEKTHSRIVTMLFDIDQVAFRRQNSIGVRLEDLKRHPKETMAALCDWMGVQDSPTLYEMTAQGKKWWGTPSSPDYEKEGMLPFSSSNIKRPVGSVFSEQDQFILRTLFYPFSVRFGYIEENIIGFKEDLKTIKPLLDEPFGFQGKLAENLSQDLDTITRSGSALFLRAALHDRWSVLAEFHDYPYMLKPLSI
jgi:tetratricopeptide (TPR) repeat protein